MEKNGELTDKSAAILRKAKNCCSKCDCGQAKQASTAKELDDFDAAAEVMAEKHKNTTQQ